ncbi:hypothetical protein [Pelagibius sp.]|uniref:hypothetical protein n=1 Tax=Pelagibius sp. TaxID=1931238 RepID=UPI003B50B2C3
MMRIVILVLLSLFILPEEIFAETYRATVVKEGAFLINEKPDLVINGRRTRGLKTYLPIGTVAIVTGKRVAIKDSKTKIPAYYEPVITNAGISGLLRADLYKMLPPGKWLVATSEDQITVLQPHKLEQRSNFTKRVGRYVRLIEDPAVGDEYYRVSLHWAKNANGEEDIGRVDASYVEEGSLVYVDTSNLREFIEKTPSIEKVYTQSDAMAGATDKMLGEAHDWIIGKLNSKYSGDVDKLKSYLTNVTLAPCDIELNAKVTVDGTFLGTGLRLETPLSLKPKGRIYYMDAYRPTKFDSDLGKHFVVFREIKCIGNLPNRMNSMIIQGSNVRGLDLILDNLPENLRGPWDSNFKSDKFRTRMVVVDGAARYSNLFNYIQKQATPGTWLGELKKHELNAFTAYLISVIAHFEKP